MQVALAKYYHRFEVGDLRLNQGERLQLSLIQSVCLVIFSLWQANIRGIPEGRIVASPTVYGCWIPALVVGDGGDQDFP